MIKAVFFDLDGTLLPMDMDQFVSGYFKLLVQKMAQYGYDPQELISNIMKGIDVMTNNDGTVTNEEAFWNLFRGIYGDKIIKDKYLFEEFYANEFNNAKSLCGFNKDADATVQYVKDKGLTAVLATNPLFPNIATKSRISWAGLNEDDFLFYTTYENCSYCKPNVKYYEYVLEKSGFKPEECLMVGNDAVEDLAAAKTGMKVFLLMDCVLHTEGVDISNVPQGSFKELRDYIDSILT